MDDSSPMELQCLAAKWECVRLVHQWAEDDIPVLIDVWKKGNGYGTCAAHDWFLWQLCEMEVPRFASIPNKIRYQIEDNMALILEQVTNWIQYHHSMNFFHDQPSFSLNEYVVKLVWNGHIEIDYEASAKNILTNENLSPLERFRFASTYCIVEEIEKFLNAIDTVPEWDFVEEPLLVYWSKYLRNELHTISVLKFFDIDTLMFFKALEKLKLRPTVEYFFDKLDSASKSYKFEYIVEIYDKRYLKDLLGKLTDKEWNLACRPAISKVVEKIAQYGTVDDVRFVWRLFQSEMDSMNFRGVLETLVPVSMRNPSDFEKWTPMLIEIWTSASSGFKQSIFNVKLWHSIGEKFLCHITNQSLQGFRASRQISEPMSFIRMLLESANNNRRKTFFEVNFYWLVIWAPFLVVDELMREFLENYDRDVFNLRQPEFLLSFSMMRSLLILVEFGEFNEYDALLTVSFQLFDACRIVIGDDFIRSSLISFKRSLMLSAGFGSLSKCLHLTDWKLLYEYAKKITSEDDFGLADFMAFCIRERYYEEMNNSVKKMAKGEMNDLKECLSATLSNAGAILENLKRRLKVHVFKALFDYDWTEERVFNRAEVQDFLLWIYNGDGILADICFKNAYLFSKGFLVQLRGCVSEGYFRATDSMEEFLEWCFSTEVERRQFKRDMIYKFREYKMIEDLLTRRRCRRRMLFWFFDGDVGLIEKFTADCAGNLMYALADHIPT